MPVALLEAHAAMLPRLYAEEQLRLMNAVAYGFGAMKEDDAAQFRRRLQEVLGDDERPRERQQLDVAALQSMGITVVREGRRASP